MRRTVADELVDTLLALAGFVVALTAAMPLWARIFCMVAFGLLAAFRLRMAWKAWLHRKRGA